MPEVTALPLVGDWRITVLSRDARWDQRVVVRDTAAGAQTLGGAPGNTLDVLGNGQMPWTLHIEHNGGSGWAPSWLQDTPTTSGIRIEHRVGSEDDTDSSSDRDFNDLIIRVQKLGLASQPVPPFAVRPETLQAMPEGIFEATLGRYFMAVRVANISTVRWPATARVGLTARCRSWLATAGVQVVDAWSSADLDALGQQVVNGQVVVGDLREWETRLVWFKVDVAAATVRKHQVEIQIFDGAAAEELDLINPKAKAPISVSRTTFDPARNAFVSRCDVGSLTASVKQLTVDLATFKSAMGRARALIRTPGGAGGGSAGGGRAGLPRACRDPKTLDWVRAQLRAFLDGQAVDLCAVYRVLACCCTGGGLGADGGDDDSWTDGRDPGLGFFAWPTLVEYGIDYLPPFEGRYGPIPFDDPWWKILLIIVAIILSLCAAASSVADLANRSDDSVIGTLTRSLLNALDAEPGTPPVSTAPGSVDAAVATLNGNRSLTAAVFTVMDAESGEYYTASPITALDGRIDAPGSILTNAAIDAIFQNLAASPSDPAAQAAVRAYKSGARSGVGRGLLAQVVPVAPRTDDGVTVYFLNQIRFAQDADTADSLSCAGDSGSLWFQEGTNAVIGLNHAGPADDSGGSATASRIEDVTNQLGIRFS